MTASSAAALAPVRDLSAPESDGARRAFLRTVSHELRTPLNAIIGFSEILSCELYGPLGSSQYREYAHIIRDSGHKLLKLVNDILELARLEGGSPDLDVCDESLPQAIDQAVLATRADAAAAGLVVVVDHAADLPAVLADERGLRTIVVNLLQRAVAVSAPGARIEVACEAEGDFVILQVRDGSGPITPEALARLGETFHVPNEEDGAGPDLALPIVRLLTRALGGSFDLAATPEGLCVTVSLRTGRGAAGPVLLRA